MDRLTGRNGLLILACPGKREGQAKAAGFDKTLSRGEGSLNKEATAEDRWKGTAEELGKGSRGSRCGPHTRDF